MATVQVFTSPVAFGRLLATMRIEWTIGDVIAKLRATKRMNQTQLAERVSVNKATIVRAEQGDTKVARETYLKIAQVLGTDLAWLEAEAIRLQTQGGTQSNSSGRTFQEWDGKTERRSGTDRRVANE